MACVTFFVFAKAIGLLIYPETTPTPPPLLSLREGFCEPWLYLEELESVKPIFLAPLTSNSYEEIEKELLTVGFNLGLAYFELN